MISGRELALESPQLYPQTRMSQEEPEYVPERMRLKTAIAEAANGIAIAAGMGMLWVMEIVRNRYFKLLDRLNFKPRARRGSAFPPGRPRRHAVKEARE
jgi:hypothetical protein